MKKKMQVKNNFFPPQFYNAIMNLISFFIGFVIIIISVISILALSTYNPGDPSWNNFTDKVLNNTIGNVGAIFSDMSLQFIGIGIFIPIVNLLIWGVRLLLLQRINLFFTRLFFVAISTLLISIGLSGLEQPDTSFLITGMGGFSGKYLFDIYTLKFSIMDNEIFILMSVIIFITLGLILLLWTWTIPPKLFYLIGKLILNIFIKSFYLIKYLLKGFYCFIFRRKHTSVSVHTKINTKIPTSINLDGNKEKAINFIDKSSRSSKSYNKKHQGSFLSVINRGFKLPPLSILSSPKNKPRNRFNAISLDKNARILENVLKDFGVSGNITEVKPGPIVTLYELDPAPGTKTSRVVSLADDIARSMSAHSVRIAVVPGSKVIGIELPNERSEVVYLREILASNKWIDAEGNLNLALGKNISGEPILSDLSKMPHLLIAGTTGSGKSVAINTMIISLLYKHSPSDVRILMIDPKMLELSVYEGIPHLLSPVITEANKAVIALKWVVKEMEERYRLMSNLSVRNIVGYNQRIEDAIKTGRNLIHTEQVGIKENTDEPIYKEVVIKKQKLPFIVVIIDEMADLMLVSGKEVEAAVQRLAQMARAAGIHVIMATQRPSVDVITGTIKANFPTRISFQVTSKVDSRTILGEQGAEQLLGQGDMLHMAAGGK
jgi:S-DNA-T family DNA segregation ATPase FtsK/SpoIIIE